MRGYIVQRVDVPLPSNARTADDVSRRKDWERISADLLLFFFFFSTVSSQWDFSHGKFGLLSPGKASCDRVALLNLPCMLDVFVFP